MRLDLESLNLRYVYVNPETNQLHVLVSVMGGVRVGTDNTCQSTVALGTFFDTIQSELNDYKNAIESDLEWVTELVEKSKKEARILQIQNYREIIQRLVQEPQILRYRNQKYPQFPEVLEGLMRKRSNLFSMRLCPTTKDFVLRMVDPVFSIDREGDSLLYRAMKAHFSDIRPPSLRERLIQAVVRLNPQSFDEIQVLLSQKIDELFKIKADFKSVPGNLQEAVQDYLNRIMGFVQPVSVSDYADALISCCGGEDLWITREDNSPFLSVPINDAKVETYSILTQFFLAELNIYCFAHQHSNADFGKQLDKFPELSEDLALMVVNTVNQGEGVEKSLIHFINTHAAAFELKSLITDDEAIDQIIHQGRRDYFTIKDSPHFDEFMVLDTEIPGQFVTHQGAICIDLSRMVQALPHLDNPYLQGIRDDAEKLPCNILQAAIDLQPIEGSIEEFITLFTGLLQKNEIKLACLLIQKNMPAVCLPSNLHPLVTVLTKTNLSTDKQRSLFLSLPEDIQLNIFNALDTDSREAFFICLDEPRQRKLFNQLSESQQILLFKSPRIHGTCFFKNLPLDQQRLMQSLTFLEQKILFEDLSVGRACELFEQLSEAEQVAIFRAVHSYLQGKLLMSYPFALWQRLMQSITAAQIAEIMSVMSPELGSSYLCRVQPKALVVFDKCSADQKALVFSLIPARIQRVLILIDPSAGFISRLANTMSLEKKCAMMTGIYREEEEDSIEKNGPGNASHTAFISMAQFFALKRDLFQLLSMDMQASYFDSLQTNKERMYCKEWLTPEALVEMIVTTGHPVFYQLFDEKQQLDIFKLFSPKHQAHLLSRFGVNQSRQRTFLQTLDSEQQAYFILAVHQAESRYLNTTQALDLLLLDEQVAAMCHLPAEFRDSILNTLSETRCLNITIQLPEQELAAFLSSSTNSITSYVFQRLSKQRQLAIFKHISIPQQYLFLLKCPYQQYTLIDTLSLLAQSNLIFSFEGWDQRALCFSLFNETQQKELIKWVCLSGNDLIMSEWGRLLYNSKSSSLVKQLSVEFQLRLCKNALYYERNVHFLSVLSNNQYISLFQALTQEGNGYLGAMFLKKISDHSRAWVMERLQDEELISVLSQNDDAATQRILLSTLPLERTLSIFSLMPPDLKAKFMVIFMFESRAEVLESYKVAYQSLANDEKEQIAHIIQFELKPYYSSDILAILKVSFKKEVQLEVPRCLTAMDNLQSLALAPASLNTAHQSQEEVIVSDQNQHAKGGVIFNPNGAVFIVLMLAAQSFLKQHPSTQNALILTGILGVSYLLLKNIFPDHAPHNARFFKTSTPQGQASHSTHPENPDAPTCP